IAPRCQSHASTRRSDRSRTDQGRIAAGGPEAPEELPGADTRGQDTHRKPTRENLNRGWQRSYQKEEKAIDVTLMLMMTPMIE
ncbi:MAG: hypothetical protein J7J06_01800, partial [Methanosarcinales archaeon]|nr:hypothetical protein [Methanosarcinales archaeon]